MKQINIKEMWENIKNMSDCELYCPKCGAELLVGDEDDVADKFDDCGDGEIECESCNEKFDIKRECTYSYEVEEK